MKQTFRIICFALFSFLFTSCHDNTVSPKQLNPPGYQQDIPWPSLADSPWPMNHHDPQNTGRSNYLAPVSGQVIKKIPASNMECGLSLGSDTTVLLATSGSHNLCKLTYNGDTLWKYDLGGNNIYTTPLVANDGTIYIARSSVMAIDKNGTLKWSFQPDNEGALGLSLSIDKAGNIYAYDWSDYLYIIDKAGKLITKTLLPDFQQTQDNLLVFSPDGKTIYYRSKNSSITAFSLVTNDALWHFGVTPLGVSPIVDCNGNVYILQGDAHHNPASFICISSSGQKIWNFDFQNTFFTYDTDPTIDKNGNTFFGIDTLYSLNWSGQLRWKKDLGGYMIYSPIVSDRDGKVIVALAKNDNKIVCFDTNGNLLWEITDAAERSPGYSPALSQNGFLFYPFFRSHNFFVIQ